MRYNFSRIICSALLFSGLATTGHTQSSAFSTTAINLKNVLEEIYYTNPILAAERENLAAVDENYAQARANWRPTLSGEASYGFQRQSLEFNDNTNAADNEDSRNPATTSLTIRQALYRGGRTIAQQNQTLAQIEAARAQLTAQEQNIFQEAVTAYMDVLQSQAQLSLTENNETVLNKNFIATQDRFDVGDVTVTDVSQAEARLARIAAEVVASGGELRNAKTRFERITGFSPTLLEMPALKLPLPENRDEAQKLALEQNPLLKQQQEEFIAARHNIRLQKGSLLPELRLEGRFNHSEDTGAFTAVDETATATARLTVPIFQQGLVYSRIRQATRVAAQERLQLVDQRREVVSIVQQAWEDLLTADARSEALDTEISAASLALDGVRQESQVGTRTVLDVLDAEQEFLNARVNKTVAERNQVVARFTLVNAIGRLTAPHLNLNVPYYRPSEHFEKIQAKWFGTNDNINRPGLMDTKNIDKPVYKEKLGYSATSGATVAAPEYPQQPTGLQMDSTPAVLEAAMQNTPQNTSKAP